MSLLLEAHHTAVSADVTKEQLVLLGELAARLEDDSWRSLADYDNKVCFWDPDLSQGASELDRRVVEAIDHAVGSLASQGAQLEVHAA